MNEIEIWEHVLKWGLAQNPTLIPDPTTWTDDDSKTMEITLQNCLPLIRFYNLSSKDFLEKVRPYKKSLNPQLYEGLLKYYLDPKSEPNDKILPPRYGKCDSKIINMNIISLISKRIDQININYQRSELYLPYEFKLLLRGSRDGFTPKVFHSLCDDKSKTVTFIKVKGTEEILGGYNPLVWKSDRKWYKCTDSFIFSFKIQNNSLNDIIFSNVKRNEKHAEHALYCGTSDGSTFGCDLRLCGRSGDYDEINCHQRDYERKIRDTEDLFLMEDYEVFQILKK